MKLSSFVGTGSGRLGGSVWAVRNGEQIVRAYQPKVLNPKSVTQNQQRAKLKVCVQMSAVLGNILYPFKQTAPAGLSARNMFTADLFKKGAVTFDTESNVARIDKTAIAISPSAIAWARAITNPTYGNGAVTGSVTVLPEYAKEGTVLTVAVIHNASNSFYVANVGSFPITAEVNQYSLPMGVTLTAEDVVLLLLAVPKESRLATVYRTINYNPDTDSYNTQLLVSDYAAAFEYLRSYNLPVSV